MKDFKDKVAAITGAANGIGKAFAEEAARRGMRLALLDIEADTLEEVKKECEALGAPKVVAIPFDVSIYEQVRLSVKRIMQEYGQIDIFFSNAGVAGAGWVNLIPPQDWEWITDVNFLGMAYCTHEVLPIMAQQGTPCLSMFTVSIGGLHKGFKIQSAYTASKHAALSLAESVRDYAETCAPHIGVSAFCPEYINTTIYDSEKRRPPQYSKPYDPFYATDNYLDYKANFVTRIQEQGMNPRFVGPRLFRAIEENQMYIVPHMHTHEMVRARHRKIEEDMLRDEELDAEYKALQSYD